MKYLFGLIIWYCTTQVYAQNLSIRGVVTDSNEVALSDIHILNRSLETGTTTNASGNFEIPARIGDTVEISSVQYINVIRIVKQGDSFDTWNIVLTSNNQLLSDIILTPYLPFLDTSSVDQGEIDMALPFKNNLVKRTYEERQYDVLKPKSDFRVIESGVELSFSVLGSFTKEFKELKVLKEIKSRDAETQTLSTSFDTTFYTKTLNISKEDISVFIDFCVKQEPDLIRLAKTKDFYKLIERLKFYSDTFKMKQE